MGATCIDLQHDCCDVTSISVRNTHKCVVKKNEHVCGRLETCVWCVQVCVSEFARLQSSNPSQNRITGGGEWPGSIFHETSPPYRISITSDDLFSFLLPLIQFHLLCLLLLFGTSISAPPLSLCLLWSFLSLSSVSSAVPLCPCPSPTLIFLCHAGEWYIVVSLVALTLSQLDQTTWTTHILSSFMSLPWIN